ncbi:hypothetical protein [Flavobacterium sp. CS20]|uniref:hypothetical protein n=1 Tax=Flavobacterium sp. CS20 TaxID=2775246 RepID=UPI001B3A025F|nr:hypothetical protein [Flavobacterium sp. CS20]QTY27793.1 hypothetical protein IGB25_04530 [Flavobacterium sp. CS20]
MGKCIYCGEKVGFLKKKHKECEFKFQQGKNEYVEVIKSSILDESNFNGLEEKLKSIRQQSYLSENLHNDLTTKAFDLAVEHFLEDGILSPDEEEKVEIFKDRFQLSQNILDKNGSYTKVGMSSILRDLTEGKIPEQRIKIDGQLPFLFQKSESLIWVFTNVEFYEQRTRTEYRGGSQGVSVRVAKGVYYRTSSFKGRPVQISEMKYIGTGLLALTTKHIYFGSPEKKIKIPINKLVSIEPYEDGIGLQKDGVTAKPQIFKNIDGWFAHNAISNLSQM